MKHQTRISIGVAALAFAALACNAQVTPAPAAVPEPPQPPQPVAVGWESDLAGEISSGVLAGLGGGTVGRTLVIPKEATDPKLLAEVEEDLNVMGRILEKAAGGRDERGRHAMGIVVRNSLSGGATAPRNLYIEGHGALFFLNVSYPLIPAAAGKTGAEAKAETSSEWEDARRELYQPKPGYEYGLPVPFLNDVTTAEYDAEKVEDLKKELITALKNAAHIRKLKSDETVTVIVTGRRSAAEAKAQPRTVRSGRSAPNVWRPNRADENGPAPKLMLRARASDIEAFQKSKLDLDEFRKHATVMVY